MAHVIGQTPRPDLTFELGRRFPSAHFRIVGALDDVPLGEIAPCAVDGYPLETRLRDGSRVVVDAEFVAVRLQRAIDSHDADASAHLVLCAGPFPTLVAPTKPSGRRTPVIRPFDVAAEEFAHRGYGRLDVMVPFAAQAAPARQKWTDAGFTCRVHVLDGRPAELGLLEWVSGLVRDGGAQVVVFDYVGFSPAALDEVAVRLHLPVVDLGHLAMDTLERHLGAI